MSKTYSTTIEITEEKEYSVTINTGLKLSAWITAGSTTDHSLNPSSYANFAALEADEKAIRQLMLVHNAVDYLATAKAGDSLMQSVINSNVCAKWINISDYAYDKLSANANIKSVMNTADKYGYGEWGKINSTTWGPLGNVPIMTANNAPYGVASASSELSASTYAYKAFDGSGEWTSSTKPAYVQYQSTSPICVKKFKLINKYNGSTSATKDFQLLASNDGSNFSVVLYSGTLNQNAGEVLEFDIDESKQGYYLYHRLYVSSNYGGSNNIRAGFQLYGRELTPLIKPMSDSNTPTGQHSTTSVTHRDNSWKAFDNDDSTMADMYSGGSTSSAPGWCKIELPNAVIPKILRTIFYSNGPSYFSSGSLCIEGSNDNSEWTLLATVFENQTPSSGRNTFINTVEDDTAYKYFRWRGYGSGNWQQCTLCTGAIYGQNYSEKEFAPGSTRKTIYDHGVVPSGAITGGTKNPDCLTLSAVGTATITINKGTRKYMGGKAGLHASGTNRLKCGSGYSNFTASNMPDSNGLDISSISGNVAVGIEQTASGTFDCTEIWIE